MDIASFIWISTFGVLIGAAVVFWGIFLSIGLFVPTGTLTASKYLWLAASASRTSGATQTTLHR